MQSTGLPSNRSFGFVFTGVFTVVCLWPLRHGFSPSAFVGPSPGLAPRWWAAGVAAAFLLTAIFAPGVLTPLNRAWMTFGRALSRITQPVFMAILYFAFVTPFGAVLRLAGKKLLAVNRDPAASTYWIERSTASGRLRDQF